MAGHSVHVLMKVYAKCLDGQEDGVRMRVEAALRPDAAPSPGDVENVIHSDEVADTETSASA